MCQFGFGEQQGTSGEIVKRAIEVLWITNYLDDIRADFFAIYHVSDWESLDGPLFVLLAERLLFYEGALQGRVKIEESSGGHYQTNTSTSVTEYEPGQKMTMAQALAGDGDRLRVLQEESVRDGGGDIFEFG